MKRVTLDLDDCCREYALFRCMQLKERGAQKVYLRESSSGTGYHVEAWGEDWDSNEYYMRAILGDDPRRVHTDLYQASSGIPSTQVLFNSKNGDRAGSWEKV